MADLACPGMEGIRRGVDGWHLPEQPLSAVILAYNGKIPGKTTGELSVPACLFITITLHIGLRMEIVQGWGQRYPWFHCLTLSWSSLGERPNHKAVQLLALGSNLTLWAVNNCLISSLLAHAVTSVLFSQ